MVHKKKQLYPQQHPVKMLFNKEHRNENSVKWFFLGPDSLLDILMVKLFTELNAIATKIFISQNKIHLN